MSAGRCKGCWTHYVNGVINGYCSHCREEIARQLSAPDLQKFHETGIYKIVEEKK